MMSNSSTSLNPALNPLSPLSLHHNDNPAVPIVLDQLTGPNFIAWSSAVRRGLSVKNKLPLIDGTLPIPFESDDNLILAAYVRANDLVLQWILNSIAPDIKRTLQYFSSAKTVWDELHIRYACSDLTRIFQLEKSLSSISQGTQSLVCYYNEFKSVWDEYMSYKTVLKCSCGAMNTCTCDLPQLMAKSQEQDCVMKFLIGLNDSYSAIRSQFLFQSPFPPLAKIYSLLLQEESQRNLKLPVQPDSVAMLANNAKYYKDKKKQPLKCEHCDVTGHTIDRCFQLIGYPPGWKGPRGPRGKTSDAKPSTNANVLVKNSEV